MAGGRTTPAAARTMRSRRRASCRLPGKAKVGFQMIRRFLADSAVYAVAALLGQGIGLLLFPFLAHHFSPREYGVIDILTLVAIIASLTVALEVNQGLGRHFVDASEQDRVDYASTALLFTVGAYTVFAAVSLPLAAPLTHVLLGRGVDPWITRVAIVWIWIAGIVYLAQDQLRWRARPRAYAVVAVTTAAVTAGSTAALVFGFGLGVIGALSGQLLGALAAAFVVFGLSRDAYALRFDRRKLSTMLAFSLPLVPSSIGVFLNGFADRLVLQHTRSLTDVGIYGVAFRIATVVTLLLAGFQGAATPLILARRDHPETPDELERIFRLFCAVALIAFLVVSLFADVEVRVLASAAYARADVLVPYLFMSALLFGVYIFAPGLSIAKRTGAFAMVSVSAGLLNLGLALALVPPLGIRGAGLATVASSAWFFLLTMFFSQRHYPVGHGWMRIGAALAVAIGLLALERAVFPFAVADAFAARGLAEKTILSVVGGVAIAALLVRRDERARVWERLRRALAPLGLRGASRRPPAAAWPRRGDRGRVRRMHGRPVPARSARAVAPPNRRARP
jgi:O-antigen/teichoic acid export membrane protein